MKSSASFQAVYYNENKVKEQKAELLTAANFHTMGTNLTHLSRSEYIAYFNKISNLNSRVKNRQFHAVLSTKEQAHTAQELKAIGEAYIKQMGYSENPYLIYFHQDTEHNHIHIVSTRVDKNGGKVDDSFEKKRSLATIQRIMQQSNKSEWTPKNLIDDIMAYNFTTEGQLKTLLEQRGYTTKEGDNRELQIWKDSIYMTSIDRATIKEKLKTPKNEQRQKQIRAIVLKYQEGRSVEELKDLLKEKFGLDLVFHQSAEAKTPFGYTVVDNAEKQVFKGSEILKMAELLKNTQNTEGGSHTKTVEHFIKNNETEALRDYLDKQDLILTQRYNQVFLVDRQNDEVFNISNHQHNIDRSLILDFDEQDKTPTISLDLSLSVGSDNEGETDRKRKRGIRR